MVKAAHFWIDEGLDFFVAGVGTSGRPAHGTRLYTGEKSLYSDNRELLWECESQERASEMLLISGVRRAVARDINSFFDRIEAPWAMVGPQSLSVMLPTLHTNSKWTLAYLREWLAGNCEGEVCLLSSTYKRRVSFANESDYMLAHLSFTGAGLL